MADSMEISDEHSTSPAYGPAPSSESDADEEPEEPEESERPEPDRSSIPASPSRRRGEGSSQAASEESGEQVVHICKRCMTSRSDPDGECPECGDTLLPIRSTSDSYLGQTVGEKYKLVEQIGSGGMGEVYLGVNEPLDQRVAVKFLNEQYTANEQVIMRFLNEARSYCRVRHPNAVTLLDYGQHDDGSLYLITEYVDGLSLTGAVDEHGALAPEQAISIVMQCCEVLSSAHDKGIIHRDLKPDNLMLMPANKGRYTVKVLDFGIAKIVDDDGPALTETGSVFGTPEFMSPEQAEGRPADPRSDVYALGIILFYASTARLPFDGESQYAVLEKQIHEAPPKASSMRDDLDVHPAIERVIETCLQKDREKRYETADDLFEALEEALAAIDGEEAAPELKTEGEWADAGGDPVDLTEMIENAPGVQTRGYPAGEPEIDSRAETATGPRVGRSRFQVGDRLRSIDLSREEPREHGVTLPDSRPDPWRRAGLILTALFVAAIAGWQIWSSLGAGTPAAGAAAGASGGEATQTARRQLSAAHASLDDGAVEPARTRLERAASTLSPEKRDDAIRELFAITRMRVRDVADASGEFERAIESEACDRANAAGEELIAVAPDAAGRVAKRLNACAEEAKGGEGSASGESSPGDGRERRRRTARGSSGAAPPQSETEGGSAPERAEPSEAEPEESENPAGAAAGRGGGRDGESDSDPSSGGGEGDEAAESETPGAAESAKEPSGEETASDTSGSSDEESKDEPEPESVEREASESGESGGGEQGSDSAPATEDPAEESGESGEPATDGSEAQSGEEDSGGPVEAPAPAGDSDSESADRSSEPDGSGAESEETTEESDLPEGMARPPSQL